MAEHKIALISDVHANLPAFEAVLAQLKKEGISRIINAGDIVDYNPFPNEVIELFQKYSIESIRGNHDCAVITGDLSGLREYAKLTSKWARDNLSKQNMVYLAGLEENMRIDIAGVQIAIHHGSPSDPGEYIYEDKVSPSLLVKAKSRILVLGHTHKPYVRNFKEGTVVNPGSVGQPRDGDWRASFALLTVGDDGPCHIELRRLEYDVKRAQAACEEIGFPELLVRWLGKGSE
jgi:putative phosphoesterase